ncbi:MAG: helix-hairpin-helix protein [Flaviaesturariibacter sp.]|nr:helix-hairpin-helix protein [Flaviaesturariibacter sp.]
MGWKQDLNNGWQNFAKGYLTLTKKDRIGCFIIGAILLSAYLLPKLTESSSAKIAIQPTPELLAAIDTLEARPKGNRYSGDETQNNYAYQYEPSQGASFTKGELFYFDPNTLSPEGWQLLGLSEKTSKTIDKYRSKGGKFRKPEDVQKIWGLPAGFYERVKDYIAIADMPKPDYATTASYPTYPKYERTERRIQAVNVNSDDTAAFIALPGIGAKLAARITNFRDKLGGFHSVEQIGETYGVPDSTFQKIKPYLSVDAAAVKKININTATKDELKTHPYIRWNLANAIVEYRNQHGAFKSLDELKNIVLVDNATYNKMAPYLSLQ